MLKVTNEITSLNEHDKDSEGEAYRQDATKPPVYCANCQHFREKNSMCKVGEKKTNPVTGKWRLVTLCEDKNADADCDAYLERDREAEKKAADKLRMEGLVFILIFLGILVATAIAGNYFHNLYFQ